jgi:hypothetical protein
MVRPPNRRPYTVTPEDAAPSRDASTRDEPSPTVGVVDQMVSSWLPVTIFVGLVTVIALYETKPITDPDPWWHLRLGEEFRGAWSLSNPGAFSPFATEPWVATQWTLEILASYLVERTDLGAVVWLTSLGVILLGAALWIGNRAHASPQAAALAAGATLLGTLTVVAPRPQLASLVLLAAVATAWWRTSEDLRPRWWLVPVGWLWACTHGFWFIGTLLGLAVVTGLAMDHRLSRRQGLLLLGIPLGSVLAAAATPAGPRLLIAPFQVTGVTDRIQEWQPPDFTNPLVSIVALMIASVLITYARRGNASWTEVAVVVLAGVLLVYAARSVALAAVLLSPLLASCIQIWLGSDAIHAPRRERWLVASGLITAAALATLATMARAPYSHPYPESVDRALAALPRGTVVYNNYFSGGWLAWRHPHLVHGVDGLTEAYHPDYLDRYFDAHQLMPGWQAFLEVEMDAEVALLPAGDRMAWELETHLDWTSLVETEDYVLLSRP